jgi:Skp family chaperone for outer membrane proteins
MLARLLKQTNFVNRLRGAWRHDADEAMKPIRKELRRIARELEQMQATLQETAVRAARGDRAATQLRLVAELNEQQRERISQLPSLLDEANIAAHIRRAV